MHMTSHSKSIDSIEKLALELSELLRYEDFKKLEKCVNSLHPADLAQAIQYLPSASRCVLVKNLSPHLPGDTFAHLDESVREELLPLLPPKELAKLVGRLTNEDVLSVLEELSSHQKTQVFDHISEKKRQYLENLKSYPENSAARLMQQDMLAVPVQWTVKEVLEYISREKKVPRTFYEIYLITKEGKLEGLVSLATVMRSAPHTPLKRLQSTQTYAIQVAEDKEEVAHHFKRYSLTSAPVISPEGYLLGIITADDVMFVLDEEAEEDLMHLGGVGGSDFYAPILSTTLARFQWLLITFLNTLLASAVISQFQVVLEKKVALAILMPIVAAMGGNAGTQVVTVVVRAIATHDLSLINFGRTLGKSLVVSFLNGLLFALIISSIAILWFHDWNLGIVLGSSLLANMVWAGVAGTLLPIVVTHIGLDPALSAGPILTTTTDVLGFAIFLGLAKAFLI